MYWLGFILEKYYLLLFKPSLDLNQQWLFKQIYNANFRTEIFRPQIHIQCELISLLLSCSKWVLKGFKRFKIPHIVEVILYSILFKFYLKNIISRPPLAFDFLSEVVFSFYFQMVTFYLFWLIKWKPLGPRHTRHFRSQYCDIAIKILQ